ncbi:hypothetical protein B0T18DRAFT_384931 [Schizothecium vesticola]|uniref:Ankyrin n=1 Tax=Schizothecium vesticola TaxID=314040 RepID=A0AA40KBD3_9PEZI|nr:hypothetical protein B0T18DRAFT_384931 [Schizothecium vesticola]
MAVDGFRPLLPPSFHGRLSLALHNTICKDAGTGLWPKHSQLWCTSTDLSSSDIPLAPRPAKPLKVKLIPTELCYYFDEWASSGEKTIRSFFGSRRGTSSSILRLEDPTPRPKPSTPLFIFSDSLGRLYLQTPVHCDVTGRALRLVTQFILREVLEHDVPERDVVADGVRTPDLTSRQVASWGQLDAPKAILARYPDMDVDAKDANGETALLRACRSGNFEFVVWLLKAAKPNAACKTVLQVCQLDKLVKKGGADPNTNATARVSWTVEMRHWLFKAPPLIRAVAAANGAAVAVLLDIAADPTVRLTVIGLRSTVLYERRADRLKNAKE